METLDFTRFFNDKNYIRLKNNPFNYLNRKRLIKFYSRKYLSSNDLSKIADIGSGISPVTPIPEKTLFIDISKPALSILQKQGLSTLYGSITSLPLEDNSINHLFCSEVLEHIESYDLALNEINRVLSHKGKAYITVPCWQHYWNIDDKFVGHYRRFHPKHLIKELESHNLRVKKVKKIGSRLDKFLTLQTVKQFKHSKKINSILVYPYILANHILSYIITLSSITSEKINSNIFLFIVEKS